MTTLSRIIDRGLAADQRLIRFVATVSDRPGGIAKLLKIIGATDASIKDIYHERAWLYSSIDKVQVKCIVETQGPEHVKLLKATLKEHDYPVLWGENLSDSGDIDGTKATPRSAPLT
jgi:threonine dehydratase